MYLSYEFARLVLYIVLLLSLFSCIIHVLRDTVVVFVQIFIYLR